MLLNSTKARPGRCSLSITQTAVIVGFFVCAAQSFANNLGENYSWKFDTSADRANKAAVTDLIEKKKAGMYKPASTTNNVSNNNSINYDIAGSYLDCNLTAQAVGNQNTASQQNPIASPTISVGASNSSTSSGNTGTSSIANGDSLDSATPNGTNQNTTTQSNDGASVASTASSNSFSSSVSGLSTNGGGASSSLNTTQGSTNSPTSTAVSSSSACDFNTVSLSPGSPINVQN
jgi:hypothetical protein